MFDNNQHAQLSVMLKKLPTAVTFDSISIFHSILAQESRLAMRQNYLEKVDLLLLSRHATEKDKNHKTHLLVAKYNTGEEDEPAGEPI